MLNLIEDEIPTYGEIITFKEREEKDLIDIKRISIVKKSHKKIIIGKSGSMLKRSERKPELIWKRF